MNHDIRVVLVNTSHPGNIGATARAMKTMGLSRLYLVNPKEFPHYEATARAAGADDLLEHAVVVDELKKAIADCEIVIGTSARSRHLPWPLLNPRECAQEMKRHSNRAMALIFGNERTGLLNEELSLCHYHVRIPTATDYSSLNLAAAVQILAYEWKMIQSEMDTKSEDSIPMANNAEMEGLFNHFEQVLIDVKFLDPAHPKFLMQRLRRLFNRAQLEREELNILRGMLSAMKKH